MLKISSNVDGTDVFLTSDTVLNDYLYGLAEYHDDERRRKNFERLYVMFPTELGQALCLWFLQEKGGAPANTRGLIAIQGGSGHTSTG